VPAKHALHTEAPGAESCPIPQSAQSPVPTAPLNFPAAHAEHIPVPDTGLLYPAIQELHAVAPCAESSPLAQSVHITLLVTPDFMVPARHTVHVCALPDTAGAVNWYPPRHLQSARAIFPASDVENRGQL